MTSKPFTTRGSQPAVRFKPPRRRERPPPSRVRSSPITVWPRDNDSNDSSKSISFCDVAQQIANDTQPADHHPDVPSSDDEVTPLRRPDAHKSAVLMPRTPVLSGRKRRANGDLVIEPRTSATKTPGSAMRRAIGATAALDFSLSQIFEATQVETSPANDPKSDPVFVRPSPQAFRLSSPPPPCLTSSPVKPADTPCSGRITDSQRNTQMQRIPTSSQPMPPSSAPTILQQNQESVFTHLSARDRAQLGSETQGALQASSPIPPPQSSPIVAQQARTPDISVQRSSNREESGDDALNVHQADDRVPATQETTASNSEECLVTDTTLLEELFPNRIMAYCGGQYNNCFPATVVEAIPHCGSYRLDARFDDGSSVVVPAEHIKWVFKLSLQPGDTVRVDMPNMKGKTFAVQGLKDRVMAGSGSGTQETASTDVFGHRTVVVCAKARRSSSADDALEPIDVPVSAIKIGPLEFPQFSSRRRDFALPAKEAGPGSAVSPTRPLVFENMAFAVTVDTKSEMKREDIERLIQLHGGRLLNTGFEELFDLPSGLFSPDTATGTTTATDLRPTSSARHLGFTALIADAHSRRQKHVHALALNLPILHHAWLRDSIAAGTPLPWAAYLLPAGSAARLGGAVRSRVLASYGPRDEEARLVTVLERRERLLDRARVLAVVGKADERRRAYLFLCVALGAGEIARVRDVGAAKAMLGEGWDWVYADVGSDKVKTSLGEVAILDDEIVVQSLIWGSLVV